MLATGQPITRGASYTSGRDLDNGVVGMFNLWLRYLSDADLEGLLVVNCFHHGGCCGRHCGEELLRKIEITKELRLEKNILSDMFSP